MRKKEKWFILGILIFALLLWALMLWLRPHNYGAICIRVDGEEYGSYSLAEDQTIPIGTTNVCEIKDGKAKMIEADCPDHLCIKQNAIDNTGGMIVCLPNKVTIEGEKAEASDSGAPEIDAVASIER